MIVIIIMIMKIIMNILTMMENDINYEFLQFYIKYHIRINKNINCT